MAAPVPPLHDDERRHRELNLYRNINHEKRHGIGPWWLWVVVVIAVIWFSAWGFHGYGGWWSKRSAPVQKTATVSTPAPAPPQQNYAEVPQLLGPQGNNMVGKEVTLRDVLVASVNGSNSIFVGSNKDKQLLVSFGDNAIPDTLQGQDRKLNKDMIVTITGVVKKVPVSIGAIRKDFKLSTSEAKQVSQQGVYVDASRVAPQRL